MTLFLSNFANELDSTKVQYFFTGIWKLMFRFFEMQFMYMQVHVLIKNP